MFLSLSVFKKESSLFLKEIFVPELVLKKAK